MLIKNYLFVMALFLLGYIPAHWGAKRPLQKLMGPRYLASYAITIGAAFFAPNVWIYQFVLIATFVATVKDRHDAVCRYVTMIALVPAVVMVVQFGSFYAGTFQPTVWLTIAMVIATAVKPNRGGERPLRGWRVEDFVVLVIFLIFTVGATRFGSITSLARQMFVGALETLLPYYVVRQNVRTAEELQKLLGCIAISGASLAVIAVYESRVGWPLFDAIQSRLSMVYGMSSSVLRRGNALRAIASFPGPLLLAYFLMLALIAWLCSRELFKSKLVWRGGIVLLGIGLIGPQSRGAFVAIVPAMIVLLVTRRRFAAAAALLAGASIGAAALFALQHSSTAIGAFVGGNRTGQFYDYRGLLLHRGMQEGWKHPIFGQSMESVIASLIDITQGEHIVDMVNTYLTVFLISGVVGLGAFGLLSAIAIRKLIARARRDDALTITRSNRAFLLAILTGTYIYIYSMSFIERMPVYVVLLLAFSRMTSAQLIRRAPRRAAEPAIEAAIRDDRFQERLVPA